MPSPHRTLAWAARAVRVQTPLQFFALALVLLCTVLLAALVVPGRVAAAVALGALGWFAAVTVMAYLHARGRSPGGLPGPGPSEPRG